MSFQAFCPNCGWDMKADEPIELGQFSMIGDGYPLRYKGDVIHLTPGQASICWHLMKASPVHVSRETLLIRLKAWEVESNLVQVLICRIRQTLRKLGIPCPIETVWSRGYRWKVPCSSTIHMIR